MAEKKFNILKYKEERSTWKSVLTDSMSLEQKELFLKRKKAVDMYINGNSINDIVKETGLHRTEPSRLVNRCSELDENGMPFGYSALIPYKRQSSYDRKADNGSDSKGLSGAFSTLLLKYTDLENFIRSTYFARKDSPKEKNITPMILHEKFLKECRKIGLTESDYPFITNDLGQRSLYRYLNELEREKSSSAIFRYGENAIQKFHAVGKGQRMSLPATRPFAQVQLDGHKIDCIMTVKIKNIDGDYELLPISRIWLLTVIDVATRTILGHYITLNTEYDRFDVLKCIKNAIEPKERIIFTIEGFHYPKEEGFHSLAIPTTEWALFDEIMLDNAMAHLAKDVVGQISEYLKCSLNFGPVATPERRGIIERFFQALETRGYHRLASTTGTGINDPRKKNAEKDAIKYEISSSDIIELTEILIAQYNNTPHENLNGFTPLQIMKQRMERGLIPRFLPTEYRENFTILSFVETRKVRGSVESGRRPYVRYLNVEYRNDVLSKAYSLVGRTLSLKINPEDLRFIEAYYEDGSEFGMLFASGKWVNTKHSLKDRERINQYLYTKKIKLTQFDDPIDIYHQSLINNSIKRKNERNKLIAFEKSIEDDAKIQNSSSIAMENKETIVEKESIPVEKKANEAKLMSNDDLKALFKDKSKKAKLL